MPYLQADWRLVRADGQTEEAPKGLWVPERDWEGWQSRGRDLQFAYRWREEAIRPGEEQYRLPSQIVRPPSTPPGTPPTDYLDEAQRAMYLEVLGADLGGVQRDNFFYTNFVEKLKQSPNDATADSVIRTMEELDFASVKWPESVGGPPPHHSPWPWDRVLKWLISNMATVGKIILKIADFVVGVLIGGGLGVSAVTVSAGVPSPQIGIEVSTQLFNDDRFWLPVRKFLDEVQAKFAEGL
jgi:hypothetical protein